MGEAAFPVAVLLMAALVLGGIWLHARSRPRWATPGQGRDYRRLLFLSVPGLMFLLYVVAVVAVVVALLRGGR